MRRRDAGQAMTDTVPPLLSVRGLTVRYPGGERPAVSGLNLDVHAGETVALVGESGCGKSTLGRMAVGLHTLTEGTRLWKGVDLERLPAEQKRQKQLAIQMIFQDPYASLNPRLRVLDIVGEAPV
ncbi:ATP-binding cassette domain-containing protein, partial [Staphylococcus aureus]|nr:ATP-binding cassette domain-containing protein [Staphylococcus aureus]